MSTRTFLGIDVGTSGVRAVLVNEHGVVLNSTSSAMSEHGGNHRDPWVWWATTEAVLGQLTLEAPVTAVCVDATSGTVLPIDADGNPVSDALMYNDPVTDISVLKRIAGCAPDESAVHGASSALARATVLQRTRGAVNVIHQADWIAGKLSGNFTISDESNALKTGYDPVQRCWPDWLAYSGVSVGMLPVVVPAGSPTGRASSKAAARFGFTEDTAIIAGVTDGCASFLATGASEPGDCVTALGTTITMKMLCDKPLFNPAYGVYSHRIGDRWLAGGASNSGGNVLAHYFSDNDLQNLSARINPNADPPYYYYPLLRPGERFPHNDAAMQPVVSPRPDNDIKFLHCLLAGMANIESLGYQRLAELGAPPMQSMRTVGGGSGNTAWTAIRERCMNVEFRRSLSGEAACGVALLARDSCMSDNTP